MNRLKRNAVFIGVMLIVAVLVISFGIRRRDTMIRRGKLELAELLAARRKGVQATVEYRVIPPYQAPNFAAKRFGLLNAIIIGPAPIHDEECIVVVLENDQVVGFCSADSVDFIPEIRAPWP